jgi:hypothetical protein
MGMGYRLQHHHQAKVMDKISMGKVPLHHHWEEGALEEL